MPLLAVPQAIGFDVKFLDCSSNPRASAGLAARTASRPMWRGIGFPVRFLLSLRVPVPNPLRSTRYVWVPSGLLDGGIPLEVGAHLCVGSKASWDAIPAEGTRFEHLAPDLKTLLQCLRRQ